jgi:hypothetical protein
MMAKASKMMAFEKSAKDKKDDKKKGIKEGSKADMKADMKMGMPAFKNGGKVKKGC